MRKIKQGKETEMPWNGDKVTILNKVIRESPPLLR